MDNILGWDFLKKCFVVYSYSTITFVFLMSWFLGRFGFFLGPKWVIFLAAIIFKTVLGFTHKAEKLLFPVLHSLLTFAFDLNLSHFGLFGAQMGNFWQSGWKPVFGSANVGRHFLVSMFTPILTFDFDLDLGSILLLGALMGYFRCWGRVVNIFWGQLM